MLKVAKLPNFYENIKEREITSGKTMIKYFMP